MKKYFIFICLACSAAMAQDTPKDDAPLQAVVALSEDDAKTCDNESNCILVTQAVWAEIMKMRASQHDCIKGRRL